MTRTHAAICRSCHASCPILVDLEQGRPVRVVGDRDNPVYHGYTCARGRALPEQHTHPERLLHTMKRDGEGRYSPIPHGQAIGEIAERVQEIIDRHGPRAVALYSGTYSALYPATTPLAYAWMKAIGSPMLFTPATIDQPAKLVAPTLLGVWEAGPQPFESADTWMMVGANPPIAKSIGIPAYNPSKHIHDGRKRGMKLIAIDPRRTEFAKLATLHLQPRPGEDPTILAGLIRVILHENLHDADFVRENTVGMDSLREAVERFTPEYVERRADIPGEHLVRAARLFASGRSGCAYAGTGPNMSRRGLLTEYLVLCLNTLCGRWLRAGERLPNPGVLTAELTPRAQPAPISPGWGFGEKLRVRGLTDTVAGLPVSALADEILLEGDGQVKALFCVGGNPMAAWPDQAKTHEALRKLELLVHFDIRWSATAKLAHYVIAPTLQLEQPAMTLPLELLKPYGSGYNLPYAQYAPALVDPPLGSDVIDEWRFFYRLAQRMGRSLRIRSGYALGPSKHRPGRFDLDMENEPSTDDLFEVMTKGSRIALEEVKHHPHGQIFEEPTSIVQPRDPACTAMLDLANDLMREQLHEVGGEPIHPRTDFAFLLICRRMADPHNSSARDIGRLNRKYRYNPAFVHPDDLQALGVAPGDVIEIRSSHGSIVAIAEADEDLRHGLVSMAHSFGDLPIEENDARVRYLGSNTGRLTPVDRDYDPYTGIPLMSSIPVNVHRFRGAVLD